VGCAPSDGIPAIDNQQFAALSAAINWLAEQEPVISLEINGDAQASFCGIDLPRRLSLYSEHIPCEIAVQLWRQT